MITESLSQQYQLEILQLLTGTHKPSQSTSMIFDVLSRSLLAASQALTLTRQTLESLNTCLDVSGIDRCTDVYLTVISLLTS